MTTSALATLAVALTSCGSLAGVAKNEFATLTTCPSDGVTVLPRPDFRPPAPPDVQPTDAARSADRQAFSRKLRDAKGKTLYSGCEWFEVSGCNQRLVLCCEQRPGRDGDKVQSCVQLSALSPPDPTAANEYGLTLSGNRVDSIRQGSAAEQAGVLEGDTILEVDHQHVGDAGVREDPSLAGMRIAELLHVSTGARHSIRVFRGKGTLDLTLEAPTAPPRAPASAR
jgi:hypothetical protein